MRTQQKQLMKEYNQQIQQAKDKEEELAKIIKKEQRTIYNVIDTILIIALIIILIIAQIRGTYNRANITVDCQGKITSINGQMNTNPNITLEQYGWTKTTTKGESYG